MPKKSKELIGTAIHNENDLARLVVLHVDINEKVKTLTKQKEELTKQIKDLMPTYSVEDSSGNFVFSKTIGDKTITATNGLRVSSSLVPQAEELLAEWGHKEFLETQIVVKVEEVKAAITSGTIKKSHAAKLFTTTETYALTTKIK